MKGQAKKSLTDLKKKTYLTTGTMGGLGECVCMCGGVRLSQATEAVEQTGICPVHLPQRLQQSGDCHKPLCEHIFKGRASTRSRYEIA